MNVAFSFSLSLFLCSIHIVSYILLSDLCVSLFHHWYSSLLCFPLFQHKNLDAALRRGEKLDTLVNASHDISAQSKLFMNNAGSMNKCCIMM